MGRTTCYNQTKRIGIIRKADEIIDAHFENPERALEFEDEKEKFRAAVHEVLMKIFPKADVMYSPTTLRAREADVFFKQGETCEIRKSAVKNAEAHLGKGYVERHKEEIDAVKDEIAYQIRLRISSDFLKRVQVEVKNRLLNQQVEWDSNSFTLEVERETLFHVLSKTLAIKDPERWVRETVIPHLPAEVVELYKHKALLLQ